MKWGLPRKTQPFLPKPTGGDEEGPNEVDTTCSTSVSDVRACRLSDHTTQVTYVQALNVHLSLKCPWPFVGTRLGPLCPGRDAGCPGHTLVLNTTLLSMWYTQANRNSKTQSLQEGNLLIMSLPSMLPEGTPSWGPSIRARLSHSNGNNLLLSVTSRQGRGRARWVTILTLSASACCVSKRCLHPASRK